MACRSTIAALTLLLLTAACGEGADQTAPSAPAEIAPGTAEILDTVLAGEHRTEAERARDPYRNPKETLLFFGLEPDMTVVEIWPGGGWYTNVIAPFLAHGGGVYYAAGLNPEMGQRAAQAVEAFRETFASDPAVYGEVNLTALGADEIAPPGSADMVLTFRNVHNWLSSGTAEDNFEKFHAALKPGGILGVVEHRADEDGDDAGGYVRESTVIALAESAGFDLEASAQINANPADTKDHPFGVWTLPPVRRSSAVRGVEDSEFDRARYDAIGESDRMTLKFRKPIAADGALLE